VAAIFLAKAQFGWRDRDDPRVKADSDGPPSVLVVPGTAPLDEWSLAAVRQQAQYREIPVRQAEPPVRRSGTPIGDGMLMRKPDPDELAN
jgi:hypothetical protein